MTIQERLRRSNLIMLVVPIVIAGILLVVGLGAAAHHQKMASSCRSRTRNTSFCSSSCATPNRCSAARTSTS